MEFLARSTTPSHIIALDGFLPVWNKFSAGFFAPIAWLIGIPWHDAPAIGNLLGLRMVTNELVAFQRLGPMKDDSRSAFLYDRHIRALRICEFQFHRHSDWRHRCARSESAKPISRGSGIRAMLCGTMANLMSASIVGSHVAMSRLVRQAAARDKDFARAERAAKFILSKTKLRPKIALVLGSGLGAFADELSERDKHSLSKNSGISALDGRWVTQASS